MKLLFEKWFEENKIPERSKRMFAESVICYKAGAYRSAFLMSYSGFFLMLYNFVLTTKFIPCNYEQSEWEIFKNKIIDEDSNREKFLFDNLISGKDKKAFILSEAIKNKLRYYKDLRNICAHGKSDDIFSCHVESLWIFIQKSLNSFIINGGINGLVQMILDYLDSRKTPLDNDTDYIILNIENSLNEDEFGNFYNLLKLKTEESNFEDLFDLIDREENLWRSILKKSDKICNYMIKYVKDNYETELSSFVQTYGYSYQLISDETFARKLWAGNYFEHMNNGKWLLMDQIVKNGIIPIEERETTYKKFCGYIYNNFQPEYDELLTKINYWTFAMDNVFIGGSFSGKYSGADGIRKINYQANLFIHVINKLGLNKELTKFINLWFSTLTYGAFYDNICAWMADDEHLKLYKKIVSDNALTDYSEKFLAYKHAQEL